MRAARVENGIIVDLWEVPSLTAFEGLTLIEVPYTVSIGASYNGTTFTNPVILDGRTYAEKRSSEYPPITDYIDGIVKGDTTQVQDYIDACLAVKTKYPKPE